MKNNRKRTKNIKKTFITAIILIISLILIITIVDRRLFEKEYLLDKYQLTNLSTPQIIERLDKITNEDKEFKSSVYPNKLTISEGQTKLEYDLSDLPFYLSIAPYIDKTHDCTNHSLMSCRSELKNKEFHVTVVDNNGNTLIDTNKTSMDNGFIGLWLPRNIEATLKVTYQDMSVTTSITTNANSNTCLTTPLKLK